MNDSPTDPEQAEVTRRFSPDDPPAAGVLERAAAMLGRAVSFVDRRGYQCELLAVAVDEPTGRVAYVESRMKKKWWSAWIDVTLKFHLRDANGGDRSANLETYNPFFGCEIGCLVWIDEAAVLIYEEKHNTYVCTCGPHWPPKYVQIENDWIISDGVLGYRDDQQDQVQRLTVPTLTPLEPLSQAEAEAVGLVPVDVYDREG